MKFTAIYSVLLGLFITFPLAHAGEITETFNSGDTLTATMLNSIKSAVNDNDTNISGLLAPKSDTLYIPGFRFVEVASILDHTATWERADFGGTFGYPSGEGYIAVVAEVNLPNGASINALGCYYADNNPTYDIEDLDYALRSSEYGSETSTNIATSLNNATSGTSTVVELAELSNLSITIDNSGFHYYIWVRILTPNGYFAPDSLSALRLDGCRIQYTYAN